MIEKNKICILTPRFPFPENGGDVLRINSIARYLKTKGYELILVSFCDGDICLKKPYFELYDTIYLVKRKKIVSFFMSLAFLLSGKPIQCGYYFSLKFLKELRRIIKIESPNFYISHLLRMTPYLEIIKQQNNSIIEMTDALSKTYALSSNAKGNYKKKVIYNIEYALIRRYEKKVIKSFKKVVLVSENDIKYLNEICENTNSLRIYTNGVNCLQTKPSDYNKNKICFVGNMRTLQNQDAVLHFVNDIFPIIKKSIPEALFTIIGAEPPEQIKSLGNNKDIVVTGFVDDIQAAVSDCCLAVAPVRVAAGIQNKVLLAMGCGTPVVMTSLISKAIPELIDNENSFIKDNDEEFAKTCILLMKDVKLRNQISQNGYSLVIKHYSWNEKLAGYENI